MNYELWINYQIQPSSSSVHLDFFKMEANYEQKHKRTLCARDGFENRITNPIYQLFYIANVEQSDRAYRTESA